MQNEEQNTERKAARGGRPLMWCAVNSESLQVDGRCLNQDEGKLKYVSARNSDRWEFGTDRYGRET
jgi:hypothetical protein